MTEWEVMEDNEEIKAEFQGYKEGMVRLKEGGWAMLPTTAAMIDTYKVQQSNQKIPIDKLCKEQELFTVFVLYTHHHPPTLTLLGCFSAPCGQI